MGNQELVTDYIKRYICNEFGLNSAIMLKGKWGCGKTYFIKEILYPNLEEVLKSKEKSLCYISLNGLSSTKEFMKRIQSVIIKVSSKFNSGEPSSSDLDIITGLDSIFDEINLQGWTSFIQGANKKVKEYIAKKNISSSVFVFDDLERCAIPLEEILGTINDLVEHRKCKCIIVANEEEIKKGQNYSKIKEKFISRTLEFIPDVDAFFKIQRELYKNQPLGELSDNNWEEFVKGKNYSFGINLRIVQSALSVANEIFEICLKGLSKESDTVIQHILNKLLTDVYNVEDYCKSGHPYPESEDDGKIVGVYNLGLSGDYSAYFEVFTFIIQAVYDGEYDERTILNHIEIYTQNIKTKGKLSPIVELKDFHYMEDEEIQEKLNQIDSSIREMSLEQACDLFNFLIPLLDMGFMYNKYSNFDQVLNHILKEIDVYETKDSLLYDVVDNHTTLKDKQHEQFIKAIQEVKDKVREKSISKNSKMETFLSDNEWLIKLQKDIKDNEYNYRNENRYLSCFNQDILIKNLEQCSNKQLCEFRDLLYRMYRRQNCLVSFSNDVDAAHMFIERLKNISIAKKINKATIKYIVGDLKVSFPKKEL